MSTERLYLQDSYLVMCKATVLAVEGDDVVLDRTPCFARTSTQVGDTGRIGDTPILDTFLDGAGQVVIHRLGPDGARPEPGETVVVEVDWAPRYTVMRAHSLMHLATIAIERIHGPETVVGAHVAPHGMRIDVKCEDRVALASVTRALSAAIAADTPIELTLLPDDPRRRIWRTTDLPGIPSDGTHVHRTGEIGDFTLRLPASERGGPQRMYATVA